MVLTVAIVEVDWAGYVGNGAPSSGGEFETKRAIEGSIWLDRFWICTDVDDWVAYDEASRIQHGCVVDIQCDAVWAHFDGGIIFEGIFDH